MKRNKVNKFPVKYAQLKLGTDKHNFLIKVDGELLKVSGKEGKCFTNIPFVNNIFLCNPDDSITLEVSKSKYFNQEQQEFDKKYNIKNHALEGEEICYSLMGNVTDPQKILITFPGVTSFGNVHYRLSALTSVQERLNNKALILAFQDKEGVFGNYMYSTSSGYLIKPIVVSLIRGLCTKYK